MNPAPFASRITGTGSAFPETRVTNHDLSKTLDTNDEWIRERTGIEERRISRVGDPNETNSALGYKASIQALEMAGKKADDIDLIIFSTCTPEKLLPSTACLLQSKLGAKRAWALDINAGCSGFVNAVSIADQYLSTGQYKTALVVGADLLSAFTNWTDRGSCILFGDAAGAAVMERVPASSTSRIISTHLGSDGSLGDLFFIEAGGSWMEVSADALATHKNKMNMKGR